MTSRPAYSPCDPALGWSETAWKPVISESHFSAGGRSPRSPAPGGRDEGMEPADLLPSDREHLGGGIELHRARPERDHRCRERKVLGLQTAEIAQHLVLGVVGVEDRMREDFRDSPQGVGKLPGERVRLSRRRSRTEERNQLLRLLGRLVERDRDGRVPEVAEIDAGMTCTGAQGS